MNWELSDVHAGFRKGRGTRDQIAYMHWIIEKAREFWKNIYFCFNDYTKAFDCVDHNKFWKILKEMGIPGHLTCLLRNLYAGQEATVTTGHGKTDSFQIRKGVREGCILSPCLFDLYAEYVMWNVRLDKAKAGLKIARRNINDLRYADDNTLMAENEEELKSVLKVKEQSEKADLKLNIQEAKIMASGPITSWQIDEETMETVRDFIFLGSRIRWWLQPQIKTLAPWKKSFDKPRQYIKKQRHYFPDKGASSQNCDFSMYGCKCWTIKKAEHWRIDAFELWCWRRLLRGPWTARRSNQLILKEISPNVHWKDWCWSWSSNTLATWCKELIH